MSGCATNESTTSAPPPAPGAHRGEAAPPAARNEGQRGEWNKTPEIGMTKAEVRARYGDPHRVVQEGGREVWEYDAKARGRDFIPVYGGFTRQYKGGSIAFGPNGRVVARKWGHKRWMY